MSLSRSFTNLSLKEIPPSPFPPCLEKRKEKKRKSTGPERKVILRIIALSEIRSLSRTSTMVSTLHNAHSTPHRKKKKNRAFAMYCTITITILLTYICITATSPRGTHPPLPITQANCFSREGKGGEKYGLCYR